MKKGREAFVGIDTAKAKNAVTVAEGGRQRELRYLGEFDAAADGVAKLVRKLADHYENAALLLRGSGPTGCGLYRQIMAMGHDCTVVAPSMVPRNLGERMKTNRRDARPWHVCIEPVSSEPCGCRMRRMKPCGISCGRGRDYRRKRQHVSAFLLRQGRIFDGKTTARPPRGSASQRLMWTPIVVSGSIRRPLLGLVPIGISLQVDVFLLERSPHALPVDPTRRVSRRNLAPACRRIAVGR